MDYEVRITESAFRDLDLILDYMVFKLRNRQAAAHFHETFFKKISALSTQPKMHEIARDQYLKHRGYRKIVIGNNIVLYTVDDASREVFISRVFYGGQKYEDLI